MAQIEAIMFLRDVELFYFCTTEEVQRIAGIAREKTFAAGETIYQLNEIPEGLYCVVEGAVLLSGDLSENRMTVGDAFGYVEILSGKRRGRAAVADVDTTVLYIEEEDFFDLLSNNIDIVKSLFRHIADIYAERDRGSHQD